MFPLLLCLLGCRMDTFVPHCDATETDLDWDEVSPLGFSAAQAMDPLSGPWSAAATTLVSPATTLLAQVQSTAGVRFVDLEEAEAPEGAAVADLDVICDDYLAVEVELAVATGDDQLDDLWALDLQVPDPAGELPVEVDETTGVPTQASFSLEMSPDELGGEVDLSAYDLEAADASSVSTSGRLHADGATDGSVELLREYSEGDSSTQTSDELVQWGDGG
ncbi:hypothetical protein L6R53_07380 [Myxococcota bacterium]|nr:hypothetical protein [Myxococcota bacterium]